MRSAEEHNSVCPSAMIMAAAALMGLGLLMVASTTASLDRPLLGSGIWRTPLGRQAIFVAVGFVLIAATAYAARPFLASPKMRRGVPLVLAGVSLALLIAAWIPGWATVRHGSPRWLRWIIGGFEMGIQPSELAKLAMVGVLAWLLTEREPPPTSFRRCFVPASLFIGLFVLLVAVEDFGTGALLGGVGVAMLLVGGIRIRYLALLGLLGCGGFTALLYAAPYRLKRVIAFLDLAADPLGAGYQPRQSLASIASGGWTGLGLGAGVQKYGYLPEAHTDFILAAICEEMGVVGAVFAISLYTVVIWLGLRTMRHAASRFERLLAFGLVAMLGVQAAMNMCVVTVMAPTTGISLPLISAGGSGLMTYCAAIGVLCAVAGRGVPAVAGEE